MKRVKRILAAAMALLIAPELGGEMFSQVGGLVQDFAVSVSAEEQGEVVVADDLAEGNTETSLSAEKESSYVFWSFNMKTIPDTMYSDDESVECIELCDGVKYIGNLAFYGCTSLECLSISESVISIGTRSFGNCENLKHIHIPADKTYSDYAGKGSLPSEPSYYFPGGCNDPKCYFNGGNGIDKSGKCGDNAYWTLCDGVLTISGTGDVTNYSWEKWRERIKEVLVNSGITSLPKYAFSSYTNLKSTNIPDSVVCIGVSLGYDVFNNCSNLTNILVDDNNLNFSSENGVLFNKDKTYLLQCPAGISGNYVIPSGVTSIRSEAFYMCRKLTSVTIPDSVTSIGYDAFARCTSLTSATISNSITTIGHDTFAGCTSLISVTIPDSVTLIGDVAFNGCTSLTHIHIPSDKTYSNYAGQGSLPQEPSYYFPGGCGDPDCPLYVNGEIPDKPIDPDNPDDPKDPNEPVDEETAKDYDFSVSVHLTNSKDEIVYNVDEKT